MVSFHWLPQGRLFSLETPALGAPPVHRSPNLIWRPVCHVLSLTSLIQVPVHILIFRQGWKLQQKKVWFCFFFKGKLKPFGDVNENASASKSMVSVSTHQKNYKQHRAKTRFVQTLSRCWTASAHRFTHTASARCGCLCVCLGRTGELNRRRTGSRRRRECLERGEASSCCEVVETFVQPVYKYFICLYFQGVN